MAETRTEDPRDPFGNPNGSNPQAGAFGELGGPVKNRPAVGAREADSVPSADSRWQPGPGATDFLGLEPEVQHGGHSSSGGATESWLFGAAQSEADFAPVSVATPARASSMPAPVPTADSPTQFDAPLDDLETDVETDVEPVAPLPRAPRGGTKQRLALAAALLALGVCGYVAWERFGPKIGSEPEVAQVDPKPAAPRPAKPTPVAPVAAAPAPVVPAVTTEPTNVITEPVLVSIEPVIEVPLASTEPIAPVVEEVPPTIDPSAPLARTTTPNKVAELPSGQPGPGGGRHATAADWAGMWLETTIPTDAIHGTTRLRTLHVGLVRAELKNREFIEGRLYAVGESRIWLDVELGRLSLDAGEVRELVQIVGQQGQPLAVGAQALAGLPRVEVLLPGGTMTGRVLGREGDWVTFITEDGLRMRVDAIDIRPAPDGRTRLVGAVQVKKP